MTSNVRNPTSHARPALLPTPTGKSTASSYVSKNPQSAVPPHTISKAPKLYNKPSTPSTTSVHTSNLVKTSIAAVDVMPNTINKPQSPVSIASSGDKSQQVVEDIRPERSAPPLSVTTTSTTCPSMTSAAAYRTSSDSSLKHKGTSDPSISSLSIVNELRKIRSQYVRFKSGTDTHTEDIPGLSIVNTDEPVWHPTKPLAHNLMDLPPPKRLKHGSSDSVSSTPDRRAQDEDSSLLPPPRVKDSADGKISLGQYWALVGCEPASTKATADNADNCAESSKNDSTNTSRPAAYYTSSQPAAYYTSSKPAAYYTSQSTEKSRGVSDRVYSSPLTGAASLHKPPLDEDTKSLLNLPISPREIAYATLVRESSLLPALPERRPALLPPPRPALLPPPRHRYNAYEDNYDRLHPGSRTEYDEVGRDFHQHDYYGKQRALPRSGMADRRQSPVRDHTTSQVKRPSYHELTQEKTTAVKPLLPGLVGDNSHGQKRTWPKHESERAPITDDLLPYVDMKSCDICQVEYTHPVHAKSHLVGKSHRKKLKVLGLPIPDYCIDKSIPAGIPQPKPSASVSDKDPTMNEEFEWPDWMWESFKDDFCSICNVPLNSGLTADAHYVGKKHLKKCKTVYTQSLKEGEPTSTVSSMFRCDICHISCSSQQIVEQHMKGQKHLTTLRWHRVANDKPNVSKVRETEVAVDLITKSQLDSKNEKKATEEAAEDFFAMAAKMNGL